MAFREASTLTVSVGSIVTGNVNSLDLANGTDILRIQDDGGALNAEVRYQLGAGDLPAQLFLLGRIQGGNDDVDVQAFNWVSSAWETIQVLEGQGGAADNEYSYKLLDRHVAPPGADLGLVRIRFFAASGLTSANLYLNQMLVEYDPTAEGGYEDGAVWVDTVNGVGGTVLGLNGTVNNPVDSLADALTIAAALNGKRIQVLPGSTLVAASAVEDFRIAGHEYAVQLGGQSFQGTVLIGADEGVSGTYSGLLEMVQCSIQGITGAELRAENCGLTDGASPCITSSGTGEIILHFPFSEVAGTGTPVVDLNSIDDVEFSLRGHAGGVEIRNMVAGALGSLDFIAGQVVIAASCTGGTLGIRGTADLTDNSGGAVTVSDDARLDLDSIWGYTVAAEPSGVFAWGASSILDLLSWLGVLAKHKVTQDANTLTVRNDDDDATLASASVTSAAGVFTRGELS